MRNIRIVKYKDTRTTIAAMNLAAWNMGKITDEWRVHWRPLCPAKCAFCTNDHTANFKGCPKFKSVLKKLLPVKVPGSPIQFKTYLYAEAKKKAKIHNISNTLSISLLITNQSFNIPFLLSFKRSYQKRHYFTLTYFYTKIFYYRYIINYNLNHFHYSLINLIMSISNCITYQHG